MSDKAKFHEYEVYIGSASVYVKHEQERRQAQDDFYADLFSGKRTKRRLRKRVPAAMRMTRADVYETLDEALDFFDADYSNFFLQGASLTGKIVRIDKFMNAQREYDLEEIRDMLYLRRERAEEIAAAAEKASQLGLFD